MRKLTTFNMYAGKMRENKKRTEIKGNKVYEEYSFISQSFWIKPLFKPSVRKDFGQVRSIFNYFLQMISLRIAFHNV